MLIERSRVRRKPDGSVDTEFYERRARRLRRAAARALWRRMVHRLAMTSTWATRRPAQPPHRASQPAFRT